MENLIEIFNKNIDNFDNNKENIPPINYELLQKNFIDSSLPENDDESFVKELFEKTQKFFRNNKDGRYPKKVHNLKIKSAPIKLTLKINGIGYWLCEMTNISLKYNTMSVFAIEQNIASFKLIAKDPLKLSETIEIIPLTSPSSKGSVGFFMKGLPGLISIKH